MWDKFASLSILWTNFVVITCGTIIIVLETIGKSDLVWSFFVATVLSLALLFFVLAASISKIKKKTAKKSTEREAELQPLTKKPESSTFQSAQDKYNTEAWNTSDFTEPPAIGSKRRP